MLRGCSPGAPRSNLNPRHVRLHQARDEATAGIVVGKGPRQGVEMFPGSNTVHAVGIGAGRSRGHVPQSKS